MYITYHYLGEYPEEALCEVTVVCRLGGCPIYIDGRNLHGKKTGDKTAEMLAFRLLSEAGLMVKVLSPLNIYARRGHGEKTLGMLFLADVRCADATGETEKTTREDIYFQHYVMDMGRVKNENEELWDVYDGERRPTGRTHRRGALIPEGDYHLVIHAWVQNEAGEILLTQRSLNKSYAEMWECSGGSALAGEDSVTAALREIYEETGLSVCPENGRCIKSVRRVNDFLDVWLFSKDFTLADVRLQERETAGARLAAKGELLSLKESEALVPYAYLDELMKEI